MRLFRGMGWRLHFARARLKLHFRQTMVAGVLLLIPIVITFLILRFVWEFVDGVLRPALENVLDLSFPGLGVAAMLLLIYLLGLLWDVDLGRRLVRRGQRLLLSLPIIGAVYAPARQLIDSFSGSGSAGFKRVVWVEYPRPGAWAIGFLTALTTGKDGISMGVIYIPTAPTPNSGWVAIIPIEDVYDTDLSVQEAMTMVFSGGIATPEHIAVTDFDPNRQAAVSAQV